jgi:hypothetical protein
MADLIRALVSALLELFVGTTGRRLLDPFSLKRRSLDFTSMFTRMAFWAAVGVLAYTISPK